jgi:hypothetical protein
LTGYVSVLGSSADLLDAEVVVGKDQTRLKQLRTQTTTPERRGEPTTNFVSSSGFVVNGHHPDA